MKKILRSLVTGLAAMVMAGHVLSLHGQDGDMRIYVGKEDAQKMYSSINMQRTSIHDPSVVYDESSKSYYIFGSHMGTARSGNLQNWSWISLPWATVNGDGSQVSASPDNAFRINQTKEVTIQGKTVPFGNFDAAAWNCALPGTNENGETFAWTVDGNMWAPDIVYNPVMKKWCQYLSLNGPAWNSCIILLTADKIEGPYVYQGPVVYTGFRNDTDERISFHKTDLELVIGKQQSLPARYRQDKWGDFWPHAIDPCVFYDEEGNLWMAYGSWSGGIYMLQLNEQTGLRDYDTVYPSDFDTQKAKVTTDPYFGKKIAGGCYVSGEGPYIEHIGDYYYLFVSYGGYAPDGGYEMRIFRSTRPDGPYKDMNGTDAIFTGWRLNFGPNADNRGEKLLGSYNKWGFMTIGECAQGHNSAIAAPDGRTYLVYHTKFNDGTAGHQVRVHQLFLNRQGWLVAAPFEYNGETADDRKIASSQTFRREEVAGPYSVLLHRYGLKHTEYEEATPSDIVLLENGKVEGAYTGTWNIYENNSYITLTLNGTTYEGVVIEQQMEHTTIQAICFTACGSNGTNLWGYRMKDKYALAYTLNTTTLPVKENQSISKNIDLYGIKKQNTVEVKWSSDRPDVLSSTGRYNPAGLTEDVQVQLKAELSCGNYFWTEDYHVTARKETLPEGDWKSGIRAYYNFDGKPFTNAYNSNQEARTMAQGSNRIPSSEADSLRNGRILHQFFGANGNCSYTQIPNPLRNERAEGMTVSLWVKRTDDVPWDAIWSFYNASANTRLYFTGNTYIGFNNGKDWFDINHPGIVVSNRIPVGEWCLVTLTVSRTEGCQLYVNGNRVRDMEYAGNCNGTAVGAATDFDYNKVMDFIQACPNFYLGYGSFWGSVDVRLDDLMIYDRALSSTDVRALNTMSNRVTDFSQLQSGSSIENVDNDLRGTAGQTYDLSGRPVKDMQKGVYIVNGKKIINR